MPKAHMHSLGYSRNGSAGGGSSGGGHHPRKKKSSLHLQHQWAPPPIVSTTHIGEQRLHFLRFGTNNLPPGTLHMGSIKYYVPS